MADKLLTEHRVLMVPHIRYAAEQFNAAQSASPLDRIKDLAQTFLQAAVTYVRQAEDFVQPCPTTVLPPPRPSPLTPAGDLPKGTTRMAFDTSLHSPR